MHVYDPMSSLGRTVWRFLLRRAAGYAAHDLSDEIGANSCPCTFHWLWYLLGQPRFSESFRVEPHEGRYGSVKGRASGQLFLAPLSPHRGDRRAAASSRTSAAIAA